jgi:pimeloyl-ACP methyl ester carboxylesterase
MKLAPIWSINAALLLGGAQQSQPGKNLIKAWEMKRRKKQPEPIIPEGAGAGDLILEPISQPAKTGDIPAERGTLIAPENSSAAGTRLITLPVIRYPASSPEPQEPIFYLAGGPGRSNLSFKPPPELLADHDIVLVGYRGVDGSIKLECSNIKKAMRGKGEDVLSPASRANLAQAAAADIEQLTQHGIDLAGYTIEAVIADLEMARSGLGYARINLLSESYGTRIAQAYAQQHPESIHRSMMIGVNPPGRFVWEADKIDQQIEYDSRLWAQDPARAAQIPDLAEAVRAVVRNMPKRWILFPINPGKVKAIAFAMLFNRRSAALVYDSFLAAQRGDPSGLVLLSVAYDLLIPALFTWGDFFSKAYSADYDPSRDYPSELNPPDSILGSPLSLLFWGSGLKWPVKSRAADLRRVPPSEVETLLVSGSNDFSTPAEYAAQELLPHLTHGEHVILAEMGHVGDFWRLQPRAALNLVKTYYATGRVDMIQFRHQPMDFHVRWGFPKIAKIALLLGIILLLLVLAGLIALIR